MPRSGEQPGFAVRSAGEDGVLSLLDSLPFTFPSVGELFAKLEGDEAGLRQAVEVSGLDWEKTQEQLGRDKGRRQTLVGFQRWGYGKALEALRVAGLVKSGDFSLRDLGAGTGVQLLDLTRSGLNPREYRAIESNEEIALIANGVLTFLRNINLLPEDSLFQVEPGDHERRDEPVDVVINNLLAQYVKGDGLVKSVEAHMGRENGVGITTDIGWGGEPGDFDEDGKMRLGSSGFYMVKTGESQDAGPLGEIFPYELRVDPDIFHGELIKGSGDSHAGWATEARDGKIYPWSYLPQSGQLDNEQLENLAGVRRVLSALWKEAGWDGRRIYDFPGQVSRLSRLCSLTRVSTLNREDGTTEWVKAAAPTVMPLTQMPYLGRLVAQGKIVDIGEAGRFPNLDTFVGETRKLLAALAEVPFSGPPNLTVYMLRNREQVEALVAAIADS